VHELLTAGSEIILSKLRNGNEFEKARMAVVAVKQGLEMFVKLET
jgi:hypothetical protein